MEEIKVGDYVRFKDGTIDQIQDIRNTLSGGKLIGFYKRNSYKSDIGFKNSVVKHSSNIIDLIECGDYVNGILVTGKEGTLLYIEIKGIDRSGYHIPISQYGEGIKSIVTKEQFQSVEFRLEE